MTLLNKSIRTKGGNMSWFKVSLTNDQVAAGELIKLKEDFMKLYIANNTPEGMALFSGKRERDNQLIYPVYFTPVSLQFAQKLVSSYSGVPCEQPKKEGMSLLVGESADSNLLR